MIALDLLRALLHCQRIRVHWPYFGTPSLSSPASTCLALGPSLCATASVPHTDTHKHTRAHTDVRKALHPLIRKGRLRSLLKQSHVATSAVSGLFSGLRGGFSHCWCPQRHTDASAWETRRSPPSCSQSGLTADKSIPKTFDDLFLKAQIMLL